MCSRSAPLSLCLLLALLLIGCNEPQPTTTNAPSPTEPATQTDTPAPTSTPTATSTPTPTALPTRSPGVTRTATRTPRPTPTASPSATPSRTATATASPSPIPSLIIQVLDGESGDGLQGATVRLGLKLSQTTDQEGRARFEGVLSANRVYPLTVTCSGYHNASARFKVGHGESERTVLMAPGLFARVTADALFRGGPAPVYPVIGKAKAGQVLVIAGQADDGDWLVVELPGGGNGWLAMSQANIEGDLARAVTMTAPPIPTPLPTPTLTPPAATPVPAAPPPPPPPPAGPNLLANPGFEEGGAGWQSVTGHHVETFSLSDHPQFIHSGDKAAFGHAYQTVYNVTPGLTYRLGAFARAWSSPYEDRTVSQEPGNIAMFVCINTVGDTNVQLDTSVCSGGANPLDTWEYVAVDATAVRDQIAVILYSRLQQAPRHNETFWDDVFLGVAPTAATPTPTPETTPEPARPAPLPFNAAALRDSMVQLQWVLEQMGGLLDRVAHGDHAGCGEFLSYYRQVIEIDTYHSIPGDWQGVYNEYIWAADNSIATNESPDLICQEGGGTLSRLDYTVARSGVEASLARLIPAIVISNEMLAP